jgi:hypothetical protein
MDWLALKSARVELPIPRLEYPFPVQRFPRPSPLPVMPTEAEMEKAEKRLELTQERDRSTVRPRNERQDKQNIKRTIHKLETAIHSERLNERDMYDAIINLHLLNKALEGIEKNQRVHSASEAFEHALLIRRIVARYLNV